MESKDKIVCRCEEVTQSEILAAIKDGCHDLDSVKRRTRAGMGMCQSKTCSVIIARMIAQETGKDPAQITPFTVRPPIRPIPASSLRGRK